MLIQHNLKSLSILFTSAAERDVGRGTAEAIDIQFTVSFDLCKVLFNVLFLNADSKQEMK